MYEVQCERRTWYDTALRNHNRTVFKEMTSWTALTWYIGLKTAFYTKHIKRKYFRIFIMMIFNFHIILQKCPLTSE